MKMYMTTNRVVSTLNHVTQVLTGSDQCTIGRVSPAPASVPGTATTRPTIQAKRMALLGEWCLGWTLPNQR